mmetsp:Transcript_108468/g.221478  ORF Transcript_108468/g.221478 Transcript_108468/m.221478 type:complete len:108 (+) Transcript_108468:1352-1675(+)
MSDGALSIENIMGGFLVDGLPRFFRLATACSELCPIDPTNKSSDGGVAGNPSVLVSNEDGISIVDLVFSVFDSSSLSSSCDVLCWDTKLSDNMLSSPLSLLRLDGRA